MASRTRATLRLEPLESRETPAVTIVNPLTATYTDVDGDKVTLKVSAGDLGGAGVFTSVPAGYGAGEQLQEINLTAVGFAGANLTISVAKVAHGDGMANVGYINATGVDIGKVAVKGDLGRIDAGDATTTTPGLKALSVRSLGRFGTDTQAAGGDLLSDINGALGALVVAGDVKDALINVIGGADGKIGTVNIGGSLIGGSNSASGKITSSGDMGVVKIRHDLLGGSGTDSGYIFSTGKLAGVTIGGSLIGGSDTNTGEIFGGDLGAVKIGLDVRGGSGISSGRIATSGNVGSVSIGGSLIGGSNTNTGSIFSSVGIGTVKIRHDLTGGGIVGSASLDRSGVIKSNGRIASVRIGGSIISGIDNSTGALTNNATIRAIDDIGSLVVKGGLIGNVTASGDSPVVISARGQAVPGATTDLAIGNITVGGRVEFANILAGYDTSLVPVNADAQIGAVTIGGDWAASNLVAGVTNAASGNTSFGDSGDASIGGGSSSIIATIDSITIQGQLFGTAGGGADHFGFVAQRIGSFKAGGYTAPLTSGVDTIKLAPTTQDVTIHQVA